MNRKLTLSMDSVIVDFAHDFSKKTNKPISRIIENYFIELKNQNAATLPKDFEELYGIFEGTKAPDKKELRRMFHEKNCN
jgi:hypothetical protein